MSTWKSPSDARPKRARSLSSWGTTSASGSAPAGASRDPASRRNGGSPCVANTSDASDAWTTRRTRAGSSAAARSSGNDAQEAHRRRQGDRGRRARRRRRARAGRTRPRRARARADRRAFGLAGAPARRGCRRQSARLTSISGNAPPRSKCSARAAAGSAAALGAGSALGANVSSRAESTATCVLAATITVAPVTTGAAAGSAQTRRTKRPGAAPRPTTGCVNAPLGDCSAISCPLPPLRHWRRSSLVSIRYAAENSAGPDQRRRRLRGKGSPGRVSPLSISQPPDSRAGVGRGRAAAVAPHADAVALDDDVDRRRPHARCGRPRRQRIQGRLAHLLARVNRRAHRQDGERHALAARVDDAQVAQVVLLDPAVRRRRQGQLRRTAPARRRRSARDSGTARGRPRRQRSRRASTRTRRRHVAARAPGAVHACDHSAAWRDSLAGSGAT